MHIRVQIIRWIGDDFPGYVECRFADRFDREWTIIEKAPVLTCGLTANSLSLVLLRAKSSQDIKMVLGARSLISPLRSLGGIEATDGTTSFQLYTEQLQASLTRS
jgi:hypothetical protein